MNEELSPETVFVTRAVQIAGIFALSVLATFAFLIWFLFFPASLLDNPPRVGVAQI